MLWSAAAWPPLFVAYAAEHRIKAAAWPPHSKSAVRNLLYHAGISLP
jgi:hypothetical protein